MYNIVRSEEKKYDLKVVILILQNRMWRKTRSKNSGSSCIGTDPNRNFDAGWCSEYLLPIKINSILEIKLSVHTLLLNQHGILGSGASWHAQIMSYFPVPWNMFDVCHSLPSRWSFQQPMQWDLLWKQQRIWDWVQEFGQLHPLQQVHHQGLPDCPLIFPAAPFPLFLHIWADCSSLRTGTFALKHTTKMACAFEVYDWQGSCILSFLVAECGSGS